MPSWVTEDVAGIDGNINVTMKRFQVRNTYGTVKPERIIELSGTRGVVTLLSNSYFRVLSGNGIAPPSAQNMINDYMKCYGRR
ncbi:MAG TPA: hypothetical protein VFC96_05715 [Anaerovoracaceae bacterium]|nr:hypothetical protein [Anaerovoracaceae bacterium]